MRVLIVDDEPLARGALAKILSANPDVEYFDSAKDAIEAQERLVKTSYDVMLLDISCPSSRASICCSICSKANGRFLR